MRLRAQVITGCVVIFVLIAIYALVWFMLVTVRKDDFHIGYYYGGKVGWGSSVYYLDQESANVYSSFHADGDRKVWDAALARGGRARTYAPFWVPMERMYQLLFGLKTFVPSHHIENQDELLKRAERLQQKVRPAVP
ncbi:MAG: hypothetical protein H0W78_14790 [Planctomycetes bacterium]|nr:hypothetical protein [Planctomycetota bacterium]